MTAARKHPATTGRTGKTPIKTIRAEVDAEFQKHSNGVLTRAAQTELVEIFDATIGKFAKKTKKDVWKDAKFRAFILLAARRIGKKVATGPNSITKSALRNAAVTVMLDMHGMCPKPKAATHFEFKKAARQGQVCEAFLESQLT